jgi:6-phosphogluconolactonase
VIRAFAGPEALAAALAEQVAGAIRNRLAADGRAAIALSGGTTPVRFLRALSAQRLDWGKVTVTLVDERWVPARSPRSNAGLLSAHLLQGEAAAARFVPLVNDAATPEDGRADIEAAMAGLLPFAAVTLGMGNDGHTASFFPGGDRLAQALNPGPGRLVETMHAPAAGEPRMTLTLPVLLAADLVAIQIEGPAKRAVLEAALAGGDVMEMPVRAVLARVPAPEVFWCP